MQYNFTMVCKGKNQTRTQKGIAKMRKKVDKVDMKVNERTIVTKLYTRSAKLIIVENLPAVKVYGIVLGAEPNDFGGPNTRGLGCTRISPVDDFEEAVKHLGEEHSHLDGIVELLLQIRARQQKCLKNGFKQVSKALRR